MIIIMKHDKHGHCFAYNPNEVNNLKSLGWYEKPKPIIQEVIEIPPTQTKKTVKNRRK